MSVPLHVKIRRGLKNRLDEMLKSLSVNATEDSISKDEVKSIFVIRINYRIGNMLFITPMIQELQSEFPNAKIDILLGASFTKTLFKGFKNVENVYDFPRKLLKNPIFLFKYIAKIRSKKYAVLINLNGGSTSDRLATLIAKSTYKVAFCNEDSFTPVNRCVKRADFEITHEALKPLELMKIFDIKPNYDRKLSIELSENELYLAKEELDDLTKHSDKMVLGIFRNARFDKKIEDDWWRDLLKEFRQINSDIIFVDILSPDILEVLDEDMIEYSQKDLRKLASFMANLGAFICADTGPMHLASASGVPTIALFKSTQPQLYGTLKKSDYSLVMGDRGVQEIAKDIYEHIQKIQR